MEPLKKDKSIEGSSIEITTISLHSKHSGHLPGTDIDILSYGEFEADGVYIHGCINIQKREKKS
jgi:hypothetical protein